jgi:methylphosphotriester-DNA--protein-cysteine methyltransferase
MMPTIDDNEAWAAFERRDRRWDGRIIGAVKTTGIYCKPSCPARRPLREHVEFFTDAEGARAAGYRPCLRCKPDEVGRDREAVAEAMTLIESAEEAPKLDELAVRLERLEMMLGELKLAFTLRLDATSCLAVLPSTSGRVAASAYDDPPLGLRGDESMARLWQR